MRLTIRISAFCRSALGKLRGQSEGDLHVDTELMRHRRELARAENQSGRNLTVQTTIDMARTQTWTGGG